MWSKYSEGEEWNTPLDLDSAVESLNQLIQNRTSKAMHDLNSSESILSSMYLQDLLREYDKASCFCGLYLRDSITIEEMCEFFFDHSSFHLLAYIAEFLPEELRQWYEDFCKDQYEKESKATKASSKSEPASATAAAAAMENHETSTDVQTAFEPYYEETLFTL